MKAYIIDSTLEIAPFQEAPRAMPVFDRSLGAWQEDVLRSCGFEVVRVSGASAIPAHEARLITFEYVFFTRRVLRSLWSRWTRSTRNGARASGVRAALPSDSLFVRTFSDLQDLERSHALLEASGRVSGEAGSHRELVLFDLFLIDAGQPFEPHQATPLELGFKEKVVSVPTPERIIGSSHWSHPITSSVIIHVRHWLHVLQMNRLIPQIMWIEKITKRPWLLPWFCARAALGSGTFLWRLLGAANIIGKSVDIHPTAVVEGSIIGDNVKIGAQAIVRGSIVGSAAVLEDRVNVAYSVIGARVFVSKYTLVVCSMLMEEANVGMSMQMCLVGRRAALTPRATPIDVVPGGRIRVRDGEVLREVSLPVLGSCYGHDTFIGADIYIAPGRAIPNGVRIAPNPARILSQIPDDLEPGRWCVVEGGQLRTY